MAKKHTLIIIVLMMLTACQPDPKTIDLYQPPGCISGQSSCLISTHSGDVQLGFNVKYLLAENPFEMHLSQVSPDLTVSAAYMEGVDMFMGKIPLFFKQQANGHWVAESMFGSCAQKQMTWRVWLTFAAKSDGKENAKKDVQTVTFNVTSYQSYAALPIASE